MVPLDASIRPPHASEKKVAKSSNAVKGQSFKLRQALTAIEIMHINIFVNTHLKISALN